MLLSRSQSLSLVEGKDTNCFVSWRVVAGALCGKTGISSRTDVGDDVLGFVTS